jgi:hypothetical protein
LRRIARRVDSGRPDRSKAGDDRSKSPAKML